MMDKYPNKYDVKCELDTCKTYPIITDSDRGEIFCGGCGFVLVQKIEDVAHEGGGRTQEEFMSQSRTGPANSLTMHDKGLSTVIGKNVDSTGHVIPDKTRQTFNRLRIWDQRSRARSISNLSRALTQLNAMRAKLGMPDHVVENAAYIYRKAVAAKLTRGRTTASLIAASLYASCRETGTPRTLGDVAKAGNIEKRILSRDLRTLIRRLGLNLNQYDVGSFIVKISNNLNLKEKTKRDALRILQDAEKANITAGKNPVAQAAASLYISCMINDEKIGQKKFSREAGVSDVTVRNMTALIRKHLKI